MLRVYHSCIDCTFIELQVMASNKGKLLPTVDISHTGTNNKKGYNPYFR